MVFNYITKKLFVIKTRLQKNNWKVQTFLKQFVVD